MVESTVRLVDTDAIGGDGGERFWHAKPEALLKKLRFWWNDDVMRGVELTLDDGTTRSHGKKVGEDAVVEFGKGERITKLRIYKLKTPTGYRCSGVKIQTEKKEFEAGPLKGTPSSLAVGLAAGIWGRSGLDIDQLGFVYAVDVVEYHLENVNYDLSQLDKKKAALTPTVAVRATYVNRDDEPRGFVFNESATASQSSNWSMSFGVKMGAKVTGETSILGLVGGKFELSAEFSWGVNFGESFARSHQVAFSANGQVPGESKVTCEGILLEGKVDVPYKGTAILTYEDGKVEKRDVTGTYTGVGAFDSQVEIGKASRLTAKDAQLEAGEIIQVKKTAKRHVLEKTVTLE